MTKQALDTHDPDILAFIDESGARGYSRNLGPDRDPEIGLMCALLFPAEHIEKYCDAFLPGYKRFLDAMPNDAKPHITDAFTPGNECWATIARSVRSEFYRLIHCPQIHVVYEARRLAVERDSHQRQQNLVSQAKELRRKKLHYSPIRIPNRLSQSKIEDELIIGLSLKLDAFCNDNGYKRMIMLFDEIDNKVVQKYRKLVADTSNISNSINVVKGWNIETKSQVQGEISTKIDAPFPVDTRHLGELHVVGKNDPLILAADIVTNSLHYHLSNLSYDAFLNHPSLNYPPLNRPSSIKGWDLEKRVYGVRDDAIEDII